MKNIINVNFMGGEILNIFLNGKMYQKNFGSVEVAKNNFIIIQSLKKEGTDEAVNAVQEIIDKRILIGKVAGMVYEPATGNIYLSGFSTPMPDLLVERIEQYDNSNFPVEPLINFWKLLMANPDRRVRNDLFKFLSTYDFSITDEGYFVAYKAVYYQQKNENDIAEFVSNAYLKVKRWKKSPVNFMVVQDPETEEYTIVDLKKTEVKDDSTIVGNLKVLFENIDSLVDEESTVFTDMHTQTMDIRLGTPVTMDRWDTDGDPSIECSSGLHVGANQYVRSFANNSSAILTCLINPMNVVAVPRYDNTKIRVCEYFPFAYSERDENGDFELIEQPYFEEDYINYEKGELERILEDMKQGEEIHVAENCEFDNRDVEELKKIISERLVSINK